ncbi:MAG: hypothetical protein K8R76_12350 [Candidatus Aegiribacteria sp.]|nr:hypothetical protein [Candidatus Aegiribacteria sp.]
MSGRMTFYYKSSILLLLRTRWIGPYLLLPPMLAFIVHAEAYLSAQGVTGIFNLEQRTVLAIWNASLLLTLIAGIKSCLFFSRLWGSFWFRNSLSLPVSRSSGFWGSFLAVLSIATVMYLLTTGAVIAALPEISRFPWIQVLAELYIPIIWAVSAGALLGLITSGTAGSLFFVAMMLLGFLTGMPSLYPSSGWLQAAIPPVGRIMTLSLVFPGGIIQAAILLAHSIIVLTLGRLLYGFGIKRR